MSIPCEGCGAADPPYGCELCGTALCVHCVFVCDHCGRDVCEWCSDPNPSGYGTECNKCFELRMAMKKAQMQ